MPLFTHPDSFQIGSSQTGGINLNEATLAGISTGSGLTATTLSFLVSTDGVTYTPLYDDTSTEVTLTSASVARSYNTKFTAMIPWNYVKAREGTAASAVNQATNNVAVTFITLK